MSGAQTRAHILHVARAAFARTGFESTSVRSIAAEAGVDQALVHRYFGTKKQLFLAVIRIPIDPDVVLAPVLTAPHDRVAEVYLRAVMTLWDSEAEPVILSVVRTMVASPDDEPLIRSFLVEIALRALEPVIEDGSETAQLRLSLVASQVVGLLLARKIGRIEPIASMSIDDVVTFVAPTLQRYLTGELPTSCDCVTPPAKSAPLSEETE